nr:hypothetical transcript [Hymenolepis microstoma]
MLIICAYDLNAPLLHLNPLLVGAFGKMMDVSLVNEGPVTITLDSRTRGNPPSDPSASTTSGDNDETGTK